MHLHCLTSLSTCRYFSSLFAASKNFPEYSGVAAGTSMALFGLSPLFLSILASTWFTDDTGTLDVTNFVAFMAVLAGVVHIIGAINLRTPKPNAVLLQSEVRRERLSSSGDRENASALDERTSLLRPSSLRPEQQSVLGLLKDPYFLLLGSLVLVTLGSVSMQLSRVHCNSILLPVRDGHIQHRYHRNIPAFFPVFYNLSIVFCNCDCNSSPASIFVKYLLSTTCRALGGLCIAGCVISSMWYSPLPSEASN